MADSESVLEACERALEGVPGGETLGMVLVGTGHEIAARIQPTFEAGNLKPRHVQLLRELALRPTTTQQHLLEVLQVDPSVLVGLLNELERNGVIRRIRDPKDRRRHLVELSARGAETFESVLAGLERTERALFAALSDEEQQTLRRLLGLIRDGHPSACSGADPTDERSAC